MRRISARVLLWRGMRRRCPRCGARGLFRRWLWMRSWCAGCGLRFEREEGGWLGSVVINLGATQLVAIAYLVAGLVLTWPDPPIARLIVVGALIVGAFGVWFNPYSKTIWVAIDLWMRQAAPEDHADVERLSAPRADRRPRR